MLRLINLIPEKEKLISKNFEIVANWGFSFSKFHIKFIIKKYLDNIPELTNKNAVDDMIIVQSSN